MLIVSGTVGIELFLSKELQIPENLAEGEVFSEPEGVQQGWQAWGCPSV